MDRKQRVLWDSAGTIFDVSADLNDFRRGSYVLPIASATDALYIGTELPFNHKFFDVSVPNAEESAITVELWNGTEWKTAIDLRDGTSLAAKTFAQDGTISFVPDPDFSNWHCEDDSTDIPDLASGPRIVDLYWAKISFSADLTSTCALSYVGDVFSDDDDLDDYYPDLAKQNLKTAFATGKTNWQAQAFAAGEEIVRDLKRQAVLRRREQIMDTTLLTIPSIHKTASIIYGGLGASYREAAALAQEKYVKTLDLGAFEVDTNGDGKTDVFEKRASSYFGTR